MTTILSTSEKETIAGRARTLQERLDTPATTGEQEVNAGEWMDEWRDRVADGNQTHFDERLERAGLSRTDCHNRLQTHSWPADEDLPDWIHRLDDLLQFVDAQPSTEIDRPTDDERPFTHVLSLLVDYASERLDQAGLSEHLSDTALADLKADLHDRLELFCAHPLFIEFKTFVARRDEALVFGDDPSDHNNPQRYYGEFIEEIRTGELKAFEIGRAHV